MKASRIAPGSKYVCAMNMVPTVAGFGLDCRTEEQTIDPGA